MPSQKTTLRDEALRLYDEFGWYVIPIWRKTKHPMFKWSEIYGYERPERDVVESWKQWDKEDAGLAVITGKSSGIIMVDADSDEALAYLKARGHGPCPTVRSGRENAEGTHLYFRHPGYRVRPVSNFAGIPKLDIRGDGGIAVLPPTLHATGRRYEWVISPDEVLPPTIPAWLDTMFKEQEEEREPFNMEEAASGLGEGKRDETLFRAAAKMRFADFPIELARASIKELNNTFEPPLPLSEALAKVKWVYSKYEAGNHAAVLSVEKEIERQRDDTPGLKTQTLSDLMAKQFPPPKWIVPGLIPEGSMILGGKSKMGKSWFMLGLCLAVTHGGMALGRYKVEEGDVLYMALEDSEEMLQERAIQLLGGRKGSERFHYVDRTDTRLDSGLLGQVDQWLEEHPDARLVVIDTLAKIKGKTNKNANLYEQDYNTVEGLTALSHKHRVCVLIVHHLNQSREIKDPMEMLSGSTGLPGGVDGAMVLLRGRDENHGFLHAYHRRLKDNVEIAIEHAEDGSWVYAGEAEEFRISKEKRQILDVLYDADELLSPKEIHERIGDPDLKVNSVNRMLIKMKNKGMVVVPYYGKYKVSAAAPQVKNDKLSVGPVSYDGEKTTREDTDQEELEGDWF